MIRRTIGLEEEATMTRRNYYVERKEILLSKRNTPTLVEAKLREAVALGFF